MTRRSFPSSPGLNIWKCRWSFLVFPSALGLPAGGGRDGCRLYSGKTNPHSSSAPAMTEVTRILYAIEQGDPHAVEQLLPLLYDELRKLASAKLAQEKPGQTLQATALVHEAYIRLVDVDK